MNVESVTWLVCRFSSGAWFGCIFAVVWLCGTRGAAQAKGAKTAVWAFRKAWGVRWLFTMRTTTKDGYLIGEGAPAVEEEVVSYEKDPRADGDETQENLQSPWLVWTRGRWYGKTHKDSGNPKLVEAEVLG